jgi:hypothetical protein
MNSPGADCRHFTISAIDFNPVTRLVDILKDRHNPCDHAANVILQGEREREANGCDQRYNFFDGGRHKEWHDHRDAGDLVRIARDEGGR